MFSPGCRSLPLAMLVPFLHGFQQMSIEQAGLLLTLLNLVGVVFRLLWGRCVDRGMPALRMLALSGLLGALGFAILACAAFSAVAPFMLFVASGGLGCGGGGVEWRAVFRDRHPGAA